MKARPAARLTMLMLAAAGAATAQEPARLEGESGVSHERLDRGRDPWGSAYVEGAWRDAGGRVLYGGLRQTERFKQRDDEVQAGIYQPFASDWTLQAELTASPEHRVLPEHAFMLGLARRLPGGWVASAGMRRTVYTETTSHLATLGLERYTGPWRLAYTLYAGRPEGAGTGVAHRLQADYGYAERSTIGLALTRGREIENAGPAGIIVSDVQEIGLVGRHWLDARWAVSYEALVHEQGDLYTRRGLRVGLRRLF